MSVVRSNFFVAKGRRVKMANSAPSHEEYMKNPDEYEEFDLAMDDAGKYKVVSKAEARRRQDLHVLTKIYDKKAGGFFNWNTYISRAENL